MLLTLRWIVTFIAMVALVEMAGAAEGETAAPTDSINILGKWNFSEATGHPELIGQTWTLASAANEGTGSSSCNLVIGQTAHQVKGMNIIPHEAVVPGALAPYPTIRLQVADLGTIVLDWSGVMGIFKLTYEAEGRPDIVAVIAISQVSNPTDVSNANIPKP